MAAILEISDGTTSVNMIKNQSEPGYHLNSWRQTLPSYKGGGTWQQSALSTGRQLVDYQFGNIINTFNLKVNQFDQDALIFEAQELLRLLQKAADYWVGWHNEPVWIRAKASEEANERFFLIYTGQIPQLSNPYSQPFLQPLCAAVFDNIDLIIESGIPTATQPGTGTCVETGVVKSYCWPWHLDLNGTNATLSADDGAINNIPIGDSTVDGWFLSSTSNLNGRLFEKAGAPLGWNAGLTVNGLEVIAAWTTPAVASSGTDEYSQDGLWHHITIAFVNASKTIFLAIDGIWVTSYVSQIAGIGAYGDVGNPLYIGSFGGASNFWDGSIGWTRISGGLRWATGVNFTAPVRCDLPPIDGNTVAQWIGVESSGATIDNQEGTAGIDATQVNCVFECDCEFDYGNTDGDTCDDEVYIANKQNIANITHVFVDDGAVFGANLMFAALPYAFLPAVPAVNDAVYFGIQTALVDSGPFCSLVLDIGTAQTGITDIVWEYWNGAWVALTPQDNTDADGAMTGVAFDTTGVNSVHWQQPAAWVTVAVNGVTGYWVRARVNTIGVPTPPTQQNRQIYSIVWPYIEIDAPQIGGDIDALSRILFYSQSLRVGAPTLPEQATLGLRSLSRGNNFDAYINISDEQNTPEITVAAGVSAAFANNINAPSGRALLYNPGGAQNIGERATITFSNDITSEYYGSYRAYVRTSEVAADFTMLLQTAFGVTFTTRTVLIDSAGPWAVYDFGKIDLFNNSPTSDVLTTATIEIHIGKLAAGAETLYVYDLILIPVDEFAGQYKAEGSASTLVNGRVLDIDGVMYPKKQRAILRLSSDLTSVISSWGTKQPGESIFHSNANQRMWIFFVDVIGAFEVAPIHWAWSVQLFKNQRYLSMRGRR